MTEFRPAPYGVLIDSDESKAPDGFLTLRRYHVVAPMEGDNFPTILGLTRHFSTVAAVAVRLAQCLEEYPTATITSVVLAFDPEDAEQMAAYFRLADEAEGETAALQ